MPDNKNRPVMFRWKTVDVVKEGGDIVRYTVMVPHQRFKRLCDKQFVDGEDYALTRVENRSLASHNHYFAALSDAYDNLPESWANQFAAKELAARDERIEYMRKWILAVPLGYRHEEVHDFDTEKDAQRFAERVRRRETFSFIKRVGSQVVIWTAKSQDMRSMGKEEFEASKKGVLDYLAEVIGVSRAKLESNAAEKVPRRVNG